MRLYAHGHQTPTPPMRPGGLAAKDTSGRARALVGCGSPWPLRYADSTLTDGSGEGRRNGLIPPRAPEMVVVLTLLGNFLEPEAQ